jgi:molecular chaperone DnaK
MPGDVTIDFGIDLGTTNSAIAVFDDELSQIIKCEATQADVTPSVVSRAGPREWVGEAAKQRVVDNLRSTFSEFKRIMGTTTTYPLADGGRISPEELSAKVLQSLREDAAGFSGTSITAAVITVPAAFDTAQTAATRRAGELAGLSYVETLQEPIAAALAYGFDKSGDGMFLVFDLGGGTFDVALLRCANGVFSVVNHRGDNDLGGGRWDSYIVDQVVVPRLRSSGFVLADAGDRKSGTFRLLKQVAEETRIELSRKEVATFHFSHPDDSGRALPDDMPLTRTDFERLIEADLGRAMDFCRDLIIEAGLSAAAVSKVILVGGPTRTPALRQSVQSLGIDLATMVDPMTVVARGAAVYAKGRTRPVAVASAPRESAVFQVVYDAMVERDKDEVVVGIKLERAPDKVQISSVRVVATDGSWDSGRVPLDNGAAIVSAKLIAPGSVTFKVTASSTDGTTVSVVPETFSVTRGVSAGAAPVNHSIGVGVDPKNGSGGRGSVEPIVKRGSTMPVFQRKTFRTNRTVSPREPDADPVRLLFLEGESLVPERNLTVGEIVISSEKITRPLPANSDVEVSIRWDQGQDPQASAYVPYLDQNFPAVLTIQNKQLPDIGALEEQVAELREKVGDGLAPSDDRAKRLHEIEVRLVDARQGDPAAAHSAAAQIGPLLDAMEVDAASELLVAEASRLEASEQWAGDIVTKFGTAEDQKTFDTLVREASGAVANGNHRDVDYRRERIVGHAWQVIFRQPGFWVEEFAELSAKAAESTDPVKAGVLIQQGRGALDRQDVDELKVVVRELWTLSPSSSAAAIQSFGIRAIN